MAFNYADGGANHPYSDFSSPPVMILHPQDVVSSEHSLVSTPSLGTSDSSTDSLESSHHQLTEDDWDPFPYPPDSEKEFDIDYFNEPVGRQGYLARATIDSSSSIYPSQTNTINDHSNQSYRMVIRGSQPGHAANTYGCNEMDRQWSRDSRNPKVEHSRLENLDPMISQDLAAPYNLNFQNNRTFGPYHLDHTQHLADNNTSSAATSIYRQQTSSVTPLGPNGGVYTEPSQFHLNNTTAYNGLPLLTAINSGAGIAPSRNSSSFNIAGENAGANNNTFLPLPDLPHRQLRTTAQPLREQPVPSAAPPRSASSSGFNGGEIVSIGGGHRPLSGDSSHPLALNTPPYLRYNKTHSAANHLSTARDPFIRLKANNMDSPVSSTHLEDMRELEPQDSDSDDGTIDPSQLSSTPIPGTIATNQTPSNQNYSYSVFTNAQMQLACTSIEEAQASMNTRRHIAIDGDDWQQVAANKSPYVLDMKIALLKLGYKPAPATREKLVYTYDPQNITSTTDKRTKEEYDSLNDADIKEWNRFNKEQIKQIRVAHVIPQNMNRAEGYAWMLVEEAVLVAQFGYVPSTSGFDHGLSCSERINAMVQLITDYPILRFEMFSGKLDVKKFAANPVGYSCKKICNMWSNLKRKQEDSKHGKSKQKDPAIYMGCHAILDVHMPKNEVPDWWKRKKNDGVLDSIIVKEDEAEEGAEAQQTDDGAADEDDEDVAKAFRAADLPGSFVKREEDDEDAHEAGELEEEDTRRVAKVSMNPHPMATMNTPSALPKVHNTPNKRGRVHTTNFDGYGMDAAGPFGAKSGSQKGKKPRSPLKIWRPEFQDPEFWASVISKMPQEQDSGSPAKKRRGNKDTPIILEDDDDLI